MPDKVTYYAVVDDLSSREQPAGVFRRTYTEDGGRSDEAFTRDLIWEYSPSLISAERGDLRKRVHRDHRGRGKPDRRTHPRQGNRREQHLTRGPRATDMATPAALDNGLAVEVEPARRCWLTVGGPGSRSWHLRSFGRNRSTEMGAAGQFGGGASRGGPGVQLTPTVCRSGSITATTRSCPRG